MLSFGVFPQSPRPKPQIKSNQGKPTRPIDILEEEGEAPDVSSMGHLGFSNLAGLPGVEKALDSMVFP